MVANKEEASVRDTRRSNRNVVADSKATGTRATKVTKIEDNKKICSESRMNNAANPIRMMSRVVKLRKESTTLF